MLLPLLGVVLLELLAYSLAAPVLRPAGDSAPGLSHQILENLGLFSFHLSSVLTPVVLLLLAFTRRPAMAAVPTMILAAVLAVLGVVAQFWSPAPPNLELALRIAYGLTLISIVAVHLGRSGDIGVRIGVAVLALPLVFHVYGAIVLRIEGEEALYSGMPESLLSMGHWALIFAATAIPYCLAPKPLAKSVLRPAPLFVAAFIGLVAVITVRKHFEVSAALASYGLGVDLGAGLPQHKIALALLALGTMAWTQVSCFLAPSAERRRIGIGLTLLLIAGYGFHWPMQYSLGAVGLLVVARAGRRVQDDERVENSAGYFRAPPIDPPTWQAYVAELQRNLSTQEGPAHTVTSNTETGKRTTIHSELHELAVRLNVFIEAEAIDRIEVIVGEVGDGPPAWTLAARPERRLGSPPAPPLIDAPVTKTGDGPFDQRFRVLDQDSWTAELLDDDLRARTTAIIDGWLAFWPGHGLGFSVHPGRGAPLDHPIPITELAFRAGTQPSAERLVTLLRLLAEIAGRGLKRV